MTYGNPLGTLPVDPINTTSSAYYTYTPGGSWQLTAIPESQKTRTNTNQTNFITGAITMGTNLSLSPLFNSNGLVGYWKFDEGSGTSTVDSSGGGNAGTWSGTGNHWTNGKVGNAGQFNGMDDYINPGTSTNFAFGTGNFSWFSWVNSSQVINQMLLLDTRNANPANGIYIYILDRYLKFYDYLTANSSNYILSPNSWYHLGVVRNSGNTTFYVNGNSAGNFTHTTNLTTQKYYIGHDVNAGGAFFYGLIDDIRIYSRALSSAEIMALYNATK